jgi:CheY-like chemotaxis protein
VLPFTATEQGDRECHGNCLTGIDVVSHRWVEPAPILLVEDEPDDVRFVERALQRAQLDNPLIVVATTEEAERACTADGGPVLVLLDVYLQGRDRGLTFLEWLRSQSRPLADTPVVIFSVSTDQTHRVRAQSLRSSLFLGKPATEEVLVDAITAFGLVRATEVRGGKRRRWLAARGREVS